jgi:hypothetical protein
MRRSSLVVVGVLLALTGAACGSSGKKTSATRRATTTTSESTTTTAQPAATTTTTAAGTAGGSRGATTTTAHGGSTGASPAPAGKTGPAPATPGKYRYKQTGKATIGNGSSNVPSEGTLTVDPAKADGSQVFHRVVDPNGSSTDTTFQFKPDGIFLKATSTQSGSGFQSVSFTCTFNPPVPAPPWPPTVGATFAGKANCGDFTTEVKGKVDGTRQATVDGAPVDVFVISVAVVTHGQLESSGTDVQWFAPSTRLVVHDESHQKGSYGPFGFSSDVTSDLVSAKPA